MSCTTFIKKCNTVRDTAIIMEHFGAYITFLLSRSRGHYNGRPQGNAKLYSNGVDMQVINKTFDFGIKVSKYPYLFYFKMVATAYQRNLNAIHMDSLINKSIELNEKVKNNNLQLSNSWNIDKLNKFASINITQNKYLQKYQTESNTDTDTDSNSLSDSANSSISISGSDSDSDSSTTSESEY